MSRLVGRFRVLLPPAPLIVVYAFIYVVASLPALIVAQRMGAAAVDPQSRRLPIVIHLGGMMIYGAYRAMAFHPFFRPGYRKWLETTPWRWGKPLPVGPAHPVVEDAVIVAAAGLPAWLAGDLHPIASYAMALVGYLVPLGFTFARTGAWGFQFPLLLGLGLALRLCQGRPAYYGAAVLASYAVAMIGLARSLRRWPWVEIESLAYDPTKGFVVEGKPGPLGWPYDRLGPRHDPPPRRLDVLDKVLLALLAGWWCYALEHVLGRDGPLFVRMFVVMNVTWILSAVRLGTTASGYAPPISLFGRIARLRPLIPSYDQVFLAPLAAVFVAAAGPGALEHAGVPLDLAIPACASVTLMTILLAGPDRRTWQLTARHRIVAGIASTGKAGEFVQTG
ncbi:MAG TPA: hypothetical protein VGH33_26310 [Isosphaeraceae bacterium]|jgi:hypothetical protein